jgi:hypothetical protein
MGICHICMKESDALLCIYKHISCTFQTYELHFSYMTEINAKEFILCYFFTYRIQ